VSLEILRLLNEMTEVPATLHQVLAVLKAALGFDAVGIRLQQGADFPYLVQDGFTEDFLATENSLLARKPDGGVCRNSDGTAALECTCGLVLSGRADPAHPLFTEGGSCLINDSFPLLQLPPEEDPRFHPRNRCIHKGFASVALIPIRNRQAIIGLIQCNDRRRDVFSLPKVQILEGIAAHIGAAMMRKQAEEAMQRAYDELEMRVTQRTAELQRANDELRAASGYARSLIEATLDPMVTIDPAGRITDVNQAMERVTGLSRDKLIGLDVADCCTEPERARAGYRRAFAEGRVLDYPLNLRSASGQQTEVLANASVYRNERDEVLGVLVTARDVTERKRVEEEKARLEIRNRQLLKSESLGRMAGAIAHHFNNQLQAVMLGLELAKLETKGGGAPLRGLTAAQQAARKAAEVSSSMLTYLGHSNGRHEAVDLGAVCQQALALLKATLPANVSLESEFALPGPVVRANANHVQQVLTNLVTNACEALAVGGGRVRVAVRTATAADFGRGRRFPIDFIPSAPAYVYLEVEDNGPGIPADVVEKVFDPFFSTKFTGRGMGLALVLGIAREHAGAVTVESTPGRGSLFRVWFPGAEPAPPAPPAAAPAAPAVAAGRGVLVVEDNAVIRQTVMITLRQAGFTVLPAADGRDAVELFRREGGGIGCVLCDLTMPGMDGWETLAALRELRPGVPVILASGYSEAQAMAGAGVERPQLFLQKPYDFELLAESLRRFLPDEPG
jgi:PAS domain S-box-containing protein